MDEVIDMSQASFGVIRHGAGTFSGGSINARIQKALPCNHLFL